MDSGSASFPHTCMTAIRTYPKNKTTTEARESGGLKKGSIDKRSFSPKKIDYLTDVCGKIGLIYTRHPLAVYQTSKFCFNAY